MNPWRPEPGIYFDIPWAQYINCPYMNPSTLKHGCRSMKRLKRAMDGECRPSEKTTAVGNAVHTLLAGEFDERFAVMPAFENDPDNLTGTGKKSTSTSTKYYKESKANWLIENEGKLNLTEVQLNVAKKVVRSIRAKRDCNEIIERATSEVTVIAEINGLLCKTRIDHYYPEKGIIADTKTTSDIEPSAFYRIAKRLGYFFSAAFHVKAIAEAPGGFQAQEYKFIAAEVQDDYDVGLINVPFQLLDIHAEKVIEAISDYRLAKVSGKFAGLYPNEGQLMIPNWDMSEEEPYETPELTESNYGTEVAF